MRFPTFSSASSVTSSLGGAMLLLAACNPYAVDPTPALPQDPAPDTSGPAETVGPAPQGQYDPSVLTSPTIAAPSADTRASASRSLSEQCYDYARAVVANNRRNDSDAQSVIGSGPTDLSRMSSVNQAFSQTSAEATYRDAYNTCMRQAQQQQQGTGQGAVPAAQPGAAQ